MSRPRKADVIPDEAIRAAYLDLDTPLRVAGKRLERTAETIGTRGRAMGLPMRSVLLTQRAQARTEKRCTRCKDGKPATIEHFDVDLRYRDGLDPHCKTCRRRRNRERWHAKVAADPALREAENARRRKGKR